MRNLIFGLLIISIYSCRSGTKENTAQSPIVSLKRQADTLSHVWIDDFKEFRNAVYVGDINKAKTFFKFPILNVNDEIWFFGKEDSEKKSKKMNGDEIVPFTEKDFGTYFKKLFPKEFIKSILKVKTDSLFQKGNFSTEFIEKDSITEYQMIVSYDKSDKTLELNLFLNSSYKDENGEAMDGGETNILYYFIVQNNGHLIFKEVRVAG